MSEFCAACQGSGEIYFHIADRAGGEIRMELCPRCWGRGQVTYQFKLEKPELDKLNQAMKSAIKAVEEKYGTVRTDQ